MKDLRAWEEGGRRLDARFDQIDKRLHEIDVKLDLLINHLVPRLPAWWHAPAAVGGMMVLLLAMCAIGKRLGLN